MVYGEKRAILPIAYVLYASIYFIMAGYRKISKRIEKLNKNEKCEHTLNTSSRYVMFTNPQNKITITCVTKQCVFVSINAEKLHTNCTSPPFTSTSWYILKGILKLNIR